MDSINYVGKLKEYADRERVTVSYEDVASDGPDHIRRFTIRAVVNGEGFPEGVGNNKKEAKKNAARNAWMALTGQSADSTKTENVAESSSSGLRSVSYISWLYDFGQKKKLAVRAVEALSVGGAFPAPRCSFVVGDKEYPAAVGKTKKEAKEEAAKLVYEEVIGGESMDTGLGKESFSSPERNEPLDEASSEFCDQMKSLSIKDADGGFTQTNFVQTINLFCQQKKLQPSYVEVRRAGPSHNPTFFYKLLLNKQEFPVAEGRSVKEAKQKAAQLALSTIKEQSETSLSDSGRATASTPTSTKDSGQVHSSSGSDWIEFKGSSQPFKSRGRTPDSRPKIKLAAKFEGARSRSKEDVINFNGMDKGESETKEAQTPLMNGRFTSEYDCIEGLGRGKFGFVYKAKRKLEGTDCAVKIVRYKKEALREVKVLSDLNHCNIVRYYICWIEDSAPQWDGSTDSSSSAQSSSDSPVKYLYIHMELCDTKTLRAWIDEKNKQDPKKSCKRREEGLGVALQIVNGVEHIHSKTLIHRDLKPANILFDRNGMVKIGDFGLVTAEIEDDAENQKERSGFKGTPSYMAPEQKRQTVYNNKVDIFAMGLIYFELLWNFPTFHERNENWKDIRHQHFPEKFRRHFYEESQMIKSMLCVHPKDRPKASKLKVELEKWKQNFAQLQSMDRDSRTL
uniref:non-specific serine/threonine protein kinase n=1 Tax=Oryzias latipes TaxID=8090 RepID=A0A3P9IPE7_ORYLA